MYQQARAAETRRTIIDAAVSLFEENGFSGTNLNQIIRRAGVSPGAFYYHFESKDAVGLAIVDDVAQRMTDLRVAYLAEPDSGLENVIGMTYQLSTMLSDDPTYWVAAYLEHTMARHTRQGLADVADRIAVYIGSIASSIKPSELRAGVTPESAARTMFTVVYGCLVMSDLVPGDLPAKVTECWRILLPGLVSPESLPRFEDLVDRIGTRD